MRRSSTSVPGLSRAPRAATAVALLLVASLLLPLTAISAPRDGSSGTLVSSLGVGSSETPAVATGLAEDASTEPDAGDETESDPDTGAQTSNVTLADLPVANAGEDLQTISDNGIDAQVFLDGTASIGDFNTITWTINGNVVGTGATGVIVLPLGTHQIVLRIFGTGSDSGIFAEDTRIVRVIFNPTADAGDDLQVKAHNELGAEVTLDGTGSTPSGDAQLSVFRWSTESNPNFAFGPTPTVFLSIGSTTLTLTVTDGDGLSDSDTVTVTVTVPSANAGPDQSVTATSVDGANVLLDGTRSVGSIVSWVWSIPGNPTLATGVTPLVLLPIGTHVVTLTVTDDQARTDTDTVTIAVSLPSGPPVVAVDPNRRTVGASVGFEVDVFPVSATVNVSLQAGSSAPIPVGSAVTNAIGEAEGTFIVPEAPGGIYTVTFSSGETVATTEFEIVRRIRVTPANVHAGAPVQVDVTGFSASTNVTIRWRVAGVWVPVGSLTTNAQGSGATTVNVPANADPGPNSVRGEQTGGAAQTNAVTVVSPAIELDKTRATVGSSVIFTITNFPINTDVTVTWRRPGGSQVVVGNATTDENGRVVGTITVPATEGGNLNRITIAGGGVSVATSFEVAPRILITPQTVSPGQGVSVSLRGYGKQETVRIRWRVAGVWIELATVTTSNTGSANLVVNVPNNADIGQNSVRGDGTVFRQQTNAVTVLASEPQ